MRGGELIPRAHRRSLGPRSKDTARRVRLEINNERKSIMRSAEVPFKQSTLSAMSAAGGGKKQSGSGHSGGTRQKGGQGAQGGSGSKSEGRGTGNKSEGSGQKSGKPGGERRSS